MAAIQIGDVVSFTDRWGQEFIGVVVKRVGFASSMPEYTVYVDDDTSSHCYGLTYCRPIIQPQFESTRREFVSIAWEHYKSILMQYPVWRDRFEQAPSYRVF